MTTRPDISTDRPLADPHATSTALGVHALTASRGVRHMGSGDARPPVMRRGATDALRLPSRMGDRLVPRQVQP